MKHGDLNGIQTSNMAKNGVKHETSFFFMDLHGLHGLYMDLCEKW
jgi:hypothetical protein